ncbi:glycosyl hydrolase 108 family protein [Paraburkholderia sediminicola]|uniref:glycosyl hydrolase 108 family protein n=1 Tax=Paraburkholderia sediminicola TaxID=458836 RepID=UPI0038B8D826
MGAFRGTLAGGFTLGKWTLGGVASLFSNNLADPGGERCGASRRALRAAGYTGQMKDLPRDTPKAIAKTLYWDPLRLDELDARVAFQIFDAN